MKTLFSFLALAASAFAAPAPAFTLRGDWRYTFAGDEPRQIFGIEFHGDHYRTYRWFDSDRIYDWGGKYEVKNRTISLYPDVEGVGKETITIKKTQTRRLDVTWHKERDNGSYEFVLEKVK